VIVLWLFNFGGIKHLSLKLCKRLELKPVQERIIVEEAIAIQGILNHSLRRQATELKNLEKLIIVIASRKNRSLYEQLDSRAS
jgi:hypothetical protein